MSKIISAVVLVGSVMAMSNVLLAGDGSEGRNAADAPVVYVTSQGLYYDSIALGTLPMKGEFQQLIPGMNGLSTEFGPGDVGHLGGRWWIDTNDNQMMDKDDIFFLCPLLGPGRDTL